ncbi:glycosyltransferase [Nostoc sp. PCC 7107]|uniref:glycosyltransferase n=1 Tax=Nostoc sp. PCC 7107 TaxID=317936 RepID=UPI00029EE39A|nr:glycosyltransferase [Nostoc sp. PCC 7107]AFY43982.1 glycosyl transferase group 1 [Nostoc sp. PCC 7107]
MLDKTQGISHPAVIIFSSLLLPASQTFVRDLLGEALENFTPYYVGSRFVKGLTLPSERAIVVNRGNFPGQVVEAAFKFSGVAPKLYQKLQQINPVLINAQFGLSGVLALPLARKLKIPLLVHFRGADATVKEEYARYASVNHWIYYRRREMLKREAQIFLAVSNFIKTKLIEQGFPEEKIITHYDGINIQKFQQDVSIPREPVVLFVGRLTEKKGCEYLIKSMARVQSILPNTKLIIIGDGSLRSELEALAAKLLSNYQFLGVQSSDVVKSWMNRAKVLAAPSVTANQGDSEGLPTVVVEAQAMALPVVSTFHAGIPEAVINGETGFLVAERDIDGLAEYILALLKDNEKWHYFSVKAREHITKNFDNSKQIKVLEGIYSSCLATRI